MLLASPASRKTVHMQDRKSTRLNSSHVRISYAVFCLKKKTERKQPRRHPAPSAALCLLHLPLTLCAHLPAQTRARPPPTRILLRGNLARGVPPRATPP